MFTTISWYALCALLKSSGLLRHVIADSEIDRLVAVREDGSRIELEGIHTFEVWVK